MAHPSGRREDGGHSNSVIPPDRRNWALQRLRSSCTTKLRRYNLGEWGGKHLILAPGVYHLRVTIKVRYPGTLVLGLGYPTLVPDEGDVAMKAANVNGVDIAGVMFDAGTENSPALLTVGSRGEERESDDGEREALAVPSALHDVFFRVGGATPDRATTSLIVNNNNVILDDIWAWRADHGNGVGWTDNRDDTGVIVNGNNVIAYGLFVEHYQKYPVICTGENGRVIMFQNEMPYDPRDVASWSHDGINGWAAFKVRTQSRALKDGGSVAAASSG